MSACNGILYWDVYRMDWHFNWSIFDSFGVRLHTHDGKRIEKGILEKYGELMNYESLKWKIVQ